MCIPFHTVFSEGHEVVKGRLEVQGGVADRWADIPTAVS